MSQVLCQPSYLGSVFGTHKSEPSGAVAHFVAFPAMLRSLTACVRNWNVCSVGGQNVWSAFLLEGLSYILHLPGCQRDQAGIMFTRTFILDLGVEVPVVIEWEPSLMQCDTADVTIDSTFALVNAHDLQLCSFSAAARCCFEMRESSPSSSRTSS